MVYCEQLSHPEEAVEQRKLGSRFPFYFTINHLDRRLKLLRERTTVYLYVELLLFVFILPFSLYTQEHTFKLAFKHLRQIVYELAHKALATPVTVISFVITTQAGANA